ncbi:hypothetical protein J7643_03945 [bacterium]|nr:hypothetical protein [bacterium]
MTGVRRGTGRRQAREGEIGQAEIRRDVAAWSREQLEQFAIVQILSSTVLRDRLRRKLAVTRSPAAALEQLIADVDRVLDVDFIERREVRSFIDDLDELLAAIETMAEVAPEQAVDAALHFLEAIPRVFERVYDECELATFCSELATLAVKLAARSSRGIWTTGQKLVKAYLTDDYGRFDEVPEIMAKAQLDRDQRLALAGILESEAARLDQFQGARLTAAAHRLRLARGPRRKVST